MTQNEILRHIDHTQLKPCATWADISRLCDEAVRYQTASVCIPPAYVARVRAAYPNLCICTVIGFPLGYSTAEVKCFEAACAVRDGADEVDMVLAQYAVKNGDFDSVEEEIRRVKQTVGTHILKVIIETCYLTEEEKKTLCAVVTRAGADFIKTSTGFGTGGATRADVALMRESVGEGVRVKAAGGIRTREDLETFLQDGCDRIGTSGAVAILTEGEHCGY